MKFAIDIIIFAAIAIFLLLRLRGSLGQYNDEDEDIAKNKSNLQPKPKNTKENNKGQIIDISTGRARRDSDQMIQDDREMRHEHKRWPTQMPDYDVVATATVHNELLQISQLNKDFNPYDFSLGAMRAYDMIVRAFYDGDEDTLKPLLKDKLFKDFQKRIKENDTNAQPAPEIPEAQEGLISDAHIDGTEVTLTFDYWSADSTTRRLDGGYDKKDLIHDRWRFVKDIKDDSDIWLLAEVVDIEDNDEIL